MKTTTTTNHKLFFCKHLHIQKLDEIYNEPTLSTCGMYLEEVKTTLLLGSLSTSITHISVKQFKHSNINHLLVYVVSAQ